MLEHAPLGGERCTSAPSRTDRATADLPPLEVLVHPGGRGARPLLEDTAHLDQVRRWRREVPLMTSVCTGALVYAAAGLLAAAPR